MGTADLPTTSSALSWVGDDRPTTRADIEAVVRDALADRYRARESSPRTITATHLDTSDRRLRAAGIELITRGRPAALTALAAGAPRVDQPIGTIKWPATIDGLPPGPVVEAVRGATDIRALLAIARSRLTGTTFAVLDQVDKTVARVTWWNVELLEPNAMCLPAVVEVTTLRGYGKDAAAVLALLAGASPLAEDRVTWLDRIHAVADPAPTSARTIRTDETADRAVADALLGYLGELQGNVDGILRDIDTEFLHDFRVAVRRTRSVLKLLGDVLPAEAVAAAVTDFRWLGDVTGPTRDLDVYLLGVDDLTADVVTTADMTPFADHIRKQRTAARGRLIRALRSARFADLCLRWRADLESVLAAPPSSKVLAVELADERLRRMFGRVSKRARAIDSDSPAELVHALRKLCKELRYLLEVFRPLAAPKAYRQVIADFKDLQGVLGDFQDNEVQAAALRQFAQEMIATGDTDVEVILAMGELAGQFAQRQSDARAELTAHHDTYLGERAAQHIDRLIRR